MIQVFKLGIGMALGYPRNGLVLGLKGQRSNFGVRVRVNSKTAIRRWLEFYECLLVINI